MTEKLSLKTLAVTIDELEERIRMQNAINEGLLKKLDEKVIDLAVVMMPNLESKLDYFSSEVLEETRQMRIGESAGSMKERIINIEEKIKRLQYHTGVC